MVEGKGFDQPDPRFIENLRDAIVRNAAKPRKPRPPASHRDDGPRPPSR
jgi:hypothetical protein